MLPDREAQSARVPAIVKRSIPGVDCSPDAAALTSSV
jgi:hypothetical protein